MTVEPISVVAPPLTRPHLLRQRWCDVAFLHWAVDPEMVAGLMPPGVRPDVFDGCTYVGLVPFRMVGTGFAAARPRRGPARSWRPTSGSTRSTRRGGAVSSSSASTPTGPSRSPPPAPRSGCPTAGPGWASPPTGRSGATPRRCGGRGAGPAAASRSGWAARPPTARSNASSPPAGACTSPGPAGPAISPMPIHRGRCAPPSVLELDDGLVAAAGLGDLTRRPPDHVMFSEGVAATFGRPGRATRPRPGTVGGPS